MLRKKLKKSYKKNNFFHLVSTPIKASMIKARKDNFPLGIHCIKIKDSLPDNFITHRWASINKKIKDFNYIDEFINRLIPVLGTYLSDIHNEKYNQNYWKMILNPFLVTYITSAFDRWNMIDNVIKKGIIKSTTLLNFGKIDKFIPLTNLELQENFANNDYFNHFFFSKIILFSEKNIVLFKNKLKIFNNREYKKNFYPTSEIKINFLKKTVIIFSKFLSNLYINNNSPVIIRNRIPFLKNIYLKFVNKAFIFNEELISYYKPKFIPKLSYRNKFKLLFKNKNKFENFVIKNLFLFLPSEYLENYQDIFSRVKELSLPKKPKYIFLVDYPRLEPLIIRYLSICKSKKTKLYLAQHGGVYGMSLYSHNEKTEIDFCDKFFTWGWKSKNKKIKKIGIFSSNLNIKNNKKGKYITYMLPAMPRYIFKPGSMFCPDNYYKEFRLLIFMIKQLEKKKIFKDLQFIKCHKNMKKNKWNELQFIKETLSNTNFFDEKINLQNICDKSKLIIYSYNSTGYLELFSNNFPTILLFNDNFDPLKEEVKPYFELLKKNNLYFNDINKLKKFLINNFASLDKWWYNSKTQSALKIFINKFAHKNDNILKDLTKQLN